MYFYGTKEEKKINVEKDKAPFIKGYVWIVYIHTYYAAHIVP